MQRLCVSYSGEKIYNSKQDLLAKHVCIQSLQIMKSKVCENDVLMKRTCKRLTLFPSASILVTCWAIFISHRYHHNMAVFSSLIVNLKNAIKVRCLRDNSSSRSFSGSDVLGSKVQVCATAPLSVGTTVVVSIGPEGRSNLSLQNHGCFHKL